MIRRMTAGALAVAGLLIFSVAASASGTTTVIPTIKAQVKLIQANPEYKSLKHLKVKTVAEAQAAIPKLQQLQQQQTQAAAAVAAASATAGQKKGQKDWVAGVREGAKGTGDLVAGLEDFVKGEKHAADVLALKADKLASSGGLLEVKGDHLLKISDKY